jgi:transposase
MIGIGADYATALLISAGDNAQRLHSEAAFAALCGTNPILASSGKTTRHRLIHGRDPRANAALHRAVVTRTHWHEPTKIYVERRTAEGKTKPEIVRCLKRYVARQLYRRVLPAVANHVSTPKQNDLAAAA